MLKAFSEHSVLTKMANKPKLSQGPLRCWRDSIFIKMIHVWLPTERLHGYYHSFSISQHTYKIWKFKNNIFSQAHAMSGFQDKQCCTKGQWHFNQKQHRQAHYSERSLIEFIEGEALNFMTNISCPGAINISLMFAFHCNKKSNEWSL